MLCIYVFNGQVCELKDFILQSAYKLLIKSFVSLIVSYARFIVSPFRIAPLSRNCYKFEIDTFPRVVNLKHLDLYSVELGIIVCASVEQIKRLSMFIPEHSRDPHYHTGIITTCIGKHLPQMAVVSNS